MDIACCKFCISSFSLIYLYIECMSKICKIGELFCISRIFFKQYILFILKIVEKIVEKYQNITYIYI